MSVERIRHLRDALSEELAVAPAHRIGRALGGRLALDLDGVMGVARAAGRRVQQAAPGILHGAATGFVAGGPAGAVVGGALGAAGAAGSSPPGAAPVAASGRPAPPIANPAALELLLAVLRPEIVEALMALALGGNGARWVPVAGVPVPVTTAAHLVKSLAEQAAAAHPARPLTRVPRYLAEAHARGQDLASPAVRAESLRALLRESASDVEEWDGPGGRER